MYRQSIRRPADKNAIKAPEALRCDYDSGTGFYYFIGGITCVMQRTTARKPLRSNRISGCFFAAENFVRSIKALYS